MARRRDRARRWSERGGDDDDGAWAMARRRRGRRVAAWSEELDEVELDAGESFAMVLVARDAEGGGWDVDRSM